MAQGKEVQGKNLMYQFDGFEMVEGEECDVVFKFKDGKETRPIRCKIKKNCNFEIIK